MLSKLGNMEAADSTEKLTSTLNGFKLEAEDASLVVDKIIDLDNRMATSANEIATALQYSAASAQQAGVSFDELTSYIATISSVSRRSAESIGQSMKTMFARLENIKLGKMFEDDTTNINDVEKALSLVNIKLRDTATSFRPMGNVMDEIAEKWSTMNEIEQSAVANAIAGVRQRENFLILMENYNQVLEAQAIQLHSAGLATERYKIYLESIEGKANTLTASMEALWEKAINDDAIKFFLDLGISATEAIDKMGGLIPILESIIALFGILTAQKIFNFFVNISTAVNGFSFSLAGLKTALTALATPVGLLQIAIASLAAIIITYQNTVKKQTDIGLENTTNAWTEAFRNLDQEVRTAIDLLNIYESIVDRIQKKQGVGDVFVNKQEIVDQGLKAVISALKDASLSYDDYMEAVRRAAEIAGYTVTENGSLVRSTTGIGRVVVKTAEDFGILTDAQLALFNAAKTGIDDWADRWTNALYTTDEYTADLISTYEQLKSEADAVSNAFKEQSENGYISVQTANELVMANADLYQYLVRTADGYIFSADAARADTFAKLQNAVASYNLESATIAAANGNYALAISLVQTSTMLAIAKTNAIGLINVLASLASLGSVKVPEAPSYGGGGGGGAAPKVETPEEKQIKVLEKEKEELEDLKKSWKDRLDAFKDFIKAQKESLRLAKEEAEFNRELAEKNKDLAELQAEIALLSLDNSEEARAKRLELEEEASELEIEIAEDKEDRKYEVQVDALNKAEDEYEKYVDNIIKGIDDQIEAINDLIEALRDMVSSATGGGGGGFPAILSELDKIKAKLAELGIDTKAFTDNQIMWIGSQIDKWLALGNTIDQIKARIASLANLNKPGGWTLENINNAAQNLYQLSHPGEDVPATMMHTGGLVVEKHHDGNFAGNLASNEVFAKLLKGEYVATEGQMDNFMKNILPRIVMESPNTLNNNLSSPTISVSMPITVQGNMDKSAVKDIDKVANKIINEINKSLKQRGFVRQTSLTGYV